MDRPDAGTHWGTIVLVNLNTKLRRFQRKVGAHAPGDPDGVLSTLQIARRLLKERGDKAIYPALDEALEMSIPLDRARAWWTAHRALVNSLPPGFSALGDYAMLPSTTVEDLDALMLSAIRNQGMVNVMLAKGKRQ